MIGLGVLIGSALTYGLCWWLWRSEQAQERWWQENEGRRNFRWPVLTDDAARAASGSATADEAVTGRHAANPTGGEP